MSTPKGFSDREIAYHAYRRREEYLRIELSDKAEKAALEEKLIAAVEAEKLIIAKIAKIKAEIAEIKAETAKIKAETAKVTARADAAEAEAEALRLRELTNR